ncbi:hypothetical protein DEO72_LG4g157 [Vigna unguiculata]|uniref:Uncharacterized protein n=1 Tax=Vigna unguiculata TaxID=3917 RepID=A0A4D6LKV7_VIGUN|nr:hypothetical protein DEO72_LG4g157 [Vigna unguiculata]
MRSPFFLSRLVVQTIGVPVNKALMLKSVQVRSGFTSWFIRLTNRPYCCPLIVGQEWQIMDSIFRHLH